MLFAVLSCFDLKSALSPYDHMTKYSVSMTTSFGGGGGGVVYYYCPLVLCG